MAKFLRNTALTVLAILALTIAALLFYPMKASIGAVVEQPAEPLPEPFRQAWRYSISETGSPFAVYLLAAQKVVRAADYPGPSLGIRPLPIAARLFVYADFAQVEQFAARSVLRPCWTKGFADLTHAEALYLGARGVVGWSADEARVRSSMRRIAERAAAAGDDHARAFVEALASPLPECE